MIHLVRQNALYRLLHMDIPRDERITSRPGIKDWALEGTTKRCSGGLGFNAVVNAFSIANQLLFCCRSVLSYDNNFGSFDMSGNLTVNQLRHR